MYYTFTEAKVSLKHGTCIFYEAKAFEVRAPTI